MLAYTVLRPAGAAHGARRRGAVWRERRRRTPLNAAVGRMGHGLGIELTELFSVAEWDRTELTPGTVDIVITAGGCELLSPRAPAELPPRRPRAHL
eukprot:gene49451-18139_t